MNNVFRRLFLVPALVLLAAPLPSLAQEYAPPANGAGTNYETRLSNVEDQLRALTGKVEQLDYTMRRYDQAVQRMQTDFESRLHTLESIPQTPAVVQAQPAPAAPRSAATAAPAVAETPEQGEEAANPETSVKGTLGALKMKDNKVTGGIAKPKTPPLPETPADYGLTAQEQYDRAFSLLRQANYEDAEKAFKSFIDKNPKDKLLDNAKYWYAETFYVRARFNDAAVAFGDAFQQNPKGTKAPDSLLKLALSLGALDKTQDACTTLIELKNKYPNAPSTIRSRAEQERVRLKCSSKKS
jgi:tol-pal system protein YbgF